MSVCVLYCALRFGARAWPEGQRKGKGGQAEPCSVANRPCYQIPVKAHRGQRPFYSSFL